MPAVIEVNHLHKRYGATVAVEDVSFAVNQGEIFGILGPNGAGKTTTVEAVVGLRRPDAGEVRVLGLDPQTHYYALIERIGIQLQQAALADRLRVWEALDLFASFYRRAQPWEPLLAQWGLVEKRNTPFGKLSGGQKQRLFIAISLLNDPEIVFLDELTTGLDPQARRSTWDLVRAIRDQGKTIILVTHFMDEAETLCDRLAIIDQGRVIALDSPSNLVRQVQAEQRVIFESDHPLAAETVRGLAGVNRVERQNGQLTVSGVDDELLVGVIAALQQQGLSFKNLRSEQPGLEDVFLALTGRPMRAD